MNNSLPYLKIIFDSKIKLKEYLFSNSFNEVPIHYD